MRITRIQISNLYNLKNVDVDLRNPTALFVGPNGSGKTNIIKCIQLVQQVFSRENPREFLREAKLEGLQDCHGEEAYVRIQAWLGNTDKQLLLEYRTFCTIILVTDLSYRILELLWKHMKEYYSGFAEEEDELRNRIREDDVKCRNLPNSSFNLLLKSLRTYRTFNFPPPLFEEHFKFLPPKLLNGLRTCQSHDNLSDENFNCETRRTHDVNVAIELNPYWNDYMFRYGDPAEISLSDNLHLPCNTEEEKKLILKLLDEIFGDVQRLGLQFKVDGKPEQECFSRFFQGQDAVGVDDVIQWLLDPNNFGNTFSLISQLQLNFFESSRSLQIYPHEVGEVIFKVVESSTGSNRKMNAFFSFCLKKFRIKYDSPKDLHEQMNKTSCLRAILADLFSSSIQVLPQDRGLFDQQPHSSLLVATKTESRLIEWKLSGKRYKQNRFKKVEDALGSLGGLKLDVVYAPSTTSSKERYLGKREIPKLTEPEAETLQRIDPEETEEALVECQTNKSEETGQNEAKQQEMSADHSQSKLRLIVTRNVAQSTSTLYGKTIPFKDCSGGEIELMMVLAAVHLTDADTVFLDEPGHSFHPPQQAQLRRWLETQRNPGQALVVVTHAIEMISPTSLKALYHMAFTGAGFTPFRLREVNKGTMPAPGVPPTLVPSESNKTESVAGNSKELKTSGHSSQDMCDPKQIELSKETVAMLMGAEMRKMFFAAGLFLVEGAADKRFLSVLRQSMLEHAIKIRDKSSNPGDLLQALRILEMDHWDILPMGGCGNAVKAYKAASDLKIPCAVVLDEDAITVKRGKKLEPFSLENWEKSSLHKELKKVKSSFVTASTVIEEIKTQPGDQRKVLRKRGIWVWRGDLETALLENRETIKEIKSFKKFLREEYSLSLCDDVSDKVHFERSLDDAVKDFKEKVETPIRDQMKMLEKELCKAEEKRNVGTEPVTNDLVKVIEDIGQLKQKLKQHDKFCSPNASKEELWEKITSRMHAEAGWAKIPWETLQEVIEASLKIESSQVSNFCKFMKQHQLRAKPRKKELPQDLIARILDSADESDDDF